MELLVFSLFAAALLVCVIFHISLLFALLLGYVIFALYAIRKGFSLPEVLGMSAQGVRAAKNILTTFVLIGILTSLWRAGGPLPAIVCYSVCSWCAPFCSTAWSPSSLALLSARRPPWAPSA